MKLYGTRTSPFVRRVRVVAALVEAPLELVDTSTEAGQLELSTLTPIWKVPVLAADERVVFDSRVINDYLLRRFGNRNVRTESGKARWREANLMNVIDGALDSAINRFYLLRDGADGDKVTYLAKQSRRVESAMSWLDKQLDGPWLSDEPRLGLTEIALMSCLEWMEFRKTYDVSRHDRLLAFLAAHRERSSFASTRPSL